MDRQHALGWRDEEHDEVEDGMDDTALVADDFDEKEADEDDDDFDDDEEDDDEDEEEEEES